MVEDLELIARATSPDESGKDRISAAPVIPPRGILPLRSAWQTAFPGTGCALCVLATWREPPLRPILRGVTDAKHLYLAADDFVNRDVGPWGKDQLAGVLRQTDPAGIRKFLQGGRCSGRRFAPHGGPPRGYLCGCTRRYAPDRLRPWPSTEPASRSKHALDAGDNVVVSEQLAAAGRGTAFLDSLDEAGIIFKHSVHGFDNELRGRPAGARGEILEPGFLLR